MVRFLLALVFTFFMVYDSAFAQTYDLSGTWMSAGGKTDPVCKYEWRGADCRSFF